MSVFPFIFIITYVFHFRISSFLFISFHLSLIISRYSFFVLTTILPNFIWSCHKIYLVCLHGIVELNFALIMLCIFIQIMETSP